MSKQWMIGGLVALVAVTGCAALKQAKADYELGKTAPLAEDEIVPRAAAEGLVEPIKPLLPTPLQPLAGVAITLITGIGLWRRGRRIRLNQPVSASPITGDWGQKLGVEFLVQHLTTIVRGVTEVGPDNSGIKRAWKVGVAIVSGAAVASLAVPAVRGFILANPDAFGLFSLIVSALAGIEKEVSKVLPIKPSEPATPA